MDKERRFGNNITQLRMKFSKYKKSILKKCIELSKLCGVEIFLTLIDAKQNYTFFSSSVPPEEFIQKKLVGEPQKKIIQISLLFQWICLKLFLIKINSNY